jgi:UDP-GlcNAc:undecaprenyl-phosphate/decaprenyl-phosphate GlcNAc-1-phosphate transferase
MLPSISLGIVFVLGLAVSHLLIPLARSLALRWGLVDQPDGRRKLQGHAVPLTGGLAIFLAAVAVLGLAAVMPGPLGEALAGKGVGLLGLLLGAVVICTVGIADDLGCLRGRHKVLGQVAAVGVVLFFGVRIESIRLFDVTLDLGLLAIPFTAFWLLGAINALNLLDGMDGLLGSVAGILCMALGGMAYLMGDLATAAVAATLGGAVLGFLRYNFPPASVYLGDCGSMLIGLVVGVLAIQSSLKGPATVALAAPAALLTLPIFDTAAAIIRRKLTGRSIYCTDRGHSHHCLLRSGMSVRVALLVVSGLSLVTVFGVLASVAWNNEVIALLAAAAVVATLVATRLFGYAEFQLLRRRLANLVASFFDPPGAEARDVAVRLQGTADWGDLWLRLTETARTLELLSVELDVNAPAIQEGYHARWDRPGDDDEGINRWRADIPLRADGRPVGRVEITGEHDGECIPETIAVFGKLIAEIEQTVTVLATRYQAAGRVLSNSHRNGSRKEVTIKGANEGRLLCSDRVQSNV